MHQPVFDTNASSAPGNGSTRPPLSAELRERNGVLLLRWLDRSGSKPSLPMQEFHNCLVLSHGSKASRLLFWNLGSHRALQAALILLPFRCTDPKQRVNSRIQLSRLQTNRTAVFTPRDSIGSTNPRWLDSASGSPVLETSVTGLIRGLRGG